MSARKTKGRAEKAFDVSYTLVYSGTRRVVGPASLTPESAVVFVQDWIREDSAEALFSADHYECKDLIATKAEPEPDRRPVKKRGLQALVAAFRKAADGESGDEEHDAAVALADAVESRIVRITCPDCRGDGDCTDCANGDCEAHPKRDGVCTTCEGEQEIELVQRVRS